MVCVYLITIGYILVNQHSYNVVLVYLITRWHAFPSLKEIVKGAYVLPSLATAVLGDYFQFEQLGNLSRPFYLLAFPPVPLDASDCLASM
jgi:hypothetical protein